MKKKLLFLVILLLGLSITFTHAQNALTKQDLNNSKSNNQISSADRPAPLKIGDEFEVNYQTAHPYQRSEAGIVFEKEFYSKNSMYIKLYFENFDLAPGDYVEIFSPNTGESVIYGGKGKIINNQGEMISTFWSQAIMDEKVIVKLFTNGNTQGHGFNIKTVAYGYSPERILEAQRMGENRTVCGTDDKEPIICYNGTEMYRKAEAVCRLIINGSGFCTGWLLGCNGNLMTNNHCIGNANDALNTDFQFNYMYTNCNGTGNSTTDTVASTSTFIKTNATLDYTLVMLPTNPTATYGYLSLRSTIPAVGERIYIPQHPGGRRKEIAVVTDTDPDANGFAQIASNNSVRTTYFADTEGGSSGSPVLSFNTNLVVAIHNTGSCTNGNGSAGRCDNLITDIGADMPTCGIDDANTNPTIAFSGSTGNNIEGTDCSFIDINFPLNIGQGPSANADVNFTIGGGTATQGIDFDIQTPSLTFPAGATNPQNLIIRIYSDALVEGDETVTIDFTVNPNGGDATANTALDQLTFTITDDDVASNAATTVDLINEDFESVPAGWTTIDEDGDGNNWTIGATPAGATHLVTDKLYSRSWVAPNTILTPDNYVMTQQITIPATFNTLNLMYEVAPATLTSAWFEEYYTVYWATDISSAAAINASSVVKPGAIITQAVVNENIDMSAYIGQTGYLVFRHHNCMDEEYIAIDNLILRGTQQTAIQTAVNNGTTFDQLPLPGNGTIYTSDSSSGNVMVDITNNNGHDYGCIDVSVARSGTGGTPYNGTTTPHLAMDKTFYINPTNAAGSGDVTVTFYFTEAEVAGWEASTFGTYSRNDLYILRDDAGPITFAPGNTIAATEMFAATMNSFGTEVSFTATFTGLTGGFVLAPLNVLSIPDVSIDNASISLYPNPTADIITIDIASSNLPEQLIIYNMLGQELISRRIEQAEDLTLDVSHLRSGVYFAKISDDDKNATLQFIRK